MFVGSVITAAYSIHRKKKDNMVVINIDDWRKLNSEQQTLLLKATTQEQVNKLIDQFTNKK